MWFKNARLYDLELSDHIRKLLQNEEEMEKLLRENAFHPCIAGEIASIGFDSVFGKHADMFCLKQEEHIILRLVEETKLIPSSVVQAKLEELVEEKEKELKREIRSNEKQQLKTALMNQLVSKAFAQRRETYVYINALKGYVAISVSSAKRAENALAMVRQAFSSFPAKCYSPRCVIEDRMTSWIAEDKLPQAMELGTDVVMRAQDDEGGTIRVSKEDLTSDEIMTHIKAGKVVTDIQIIYDNACSLVLSSDLSIKRLALLDQYIETNLPQSTNDMVLDLQSTFILQGCLLSQLSQSIIEIFNCEKA